MEAVLHILGLCPDHFNHLSLIDVYLNLQQATFKGIPYYIKEVLQKLKLIKA
jgi:hypothetical protein